MSSNRLSALLRLSAVRQAFWLLALFSTITLIAWGGTYWFMQREILRAVDARLAARMEAAILMMDAGDTLPRPGDDQTAAIVTSAELDGFRSLDTDPSGPDMRYLLRTTEHGRVLLGENIERQEELRDILSVGMQLSLLATLLATAIAALWLARRGQARLNVVSAGLAQVAEGRLDTRITLEGQDDLSLLAKRINATTERLDNAMAQMRVQSSNIAHDLRTPLARLRAEIETSLIKATEQGRAVSPEELGAALEQIDRITGTFDALLRLARIESGAGREAFASVDLKDLVESVAETFSAVVEDRGQSLSVEIEDAREIRGDRDMLIQLLANLIQNALRHGAEEQTITLRVHGPQLWVSDQGPGIPLDERKSVLRTLYRGEASRQGEGFGLGLSLVRAIAELHGAELTLSDGPEGQGLSVRLRFPSLTEL
ncbi:MAG: HAMP domain-containing sensor histidine kinase [Pseudomonadota bacterium]